MDFRYFNHLELGYIGIEAAQKNGIQPEIGSLTSKTVDPSAKNHD
jgi:hypothetical protein